MLPSGTRFTTWDNVWKPYFVYNIVHRLRLWSRPNADSENSNIPSKYCSPMEHSSLSSWTYSNVPLSKTEWPHTDVVFQVSIKRTKMFPISPSNVYLICVFAVSPRGLPWRCRCCLSPLVCTTGGTALTCSGERACWYTWRRPVRTILYAVMQRDKMTTLTSTNSSSIPNAWWLEQTKIIYNRL